MSKIKIGSIVEVTNPAFPQNKGIKYRVIKIKDMYGTDKTYFGVITFSPSTSNFAIGEEVNWNGCHVKLVEEEFSPRAITFTEIQAGDKIRVSYKYEDTEITRTGVVDKFCSLGDLWRTKRGISISKSIRNEKIELLYRKKPLNEADYAAGTVVMFPSQREMLCTKIGDSTWSIYQDEDAWTISGARMNRELRHPNNTDMKFINTILSS